MVINISWDTDFLFILSQVFMFVAFLALIISFTTRNRRNLLIFNLIQIIFACLAHLLLGAWSAVAMAGVATFRNVAFLIHEKVRGKSDKVTNFDHIILGIVLISSLILGYFTFESFLSMFSVFGTVLSSIAVYQKSIKVFRILGVPIETLWIIYEIYIGSLIGMLMESFLLGVAIASIIFYKQMEKLVKENNNLKIKLNTK